MCTTSKAQMMIGGEFGIGYLSDCFAVQLQPKIGYQFNDKWAVGAGGGFCYSENSSMGLLGAYVRYNIWHNERFFFDLKAVSNFGISESELAFSDVGLAPSFRFKVNNHVEFAANIGFVGAQYIDQEWTPGVGLNPTNTSLEFIYKFIAVR